MDAPGPPSDDARTQLADDANLRRGILGYAYKVTHDIEKAKAVAQQTFILVLEGEGWHAWAPGAKKTLFSHMCSIVDSLVANERSRAEMRRTTSADEDLDDHAPDSSPRIDERVEALEVHEERMELAREVMSRLDERARRMLQLEQEGIHDAATQAQRLGCTVDAIHNARERVAYHRSAVLEEHARKARRQ